jgi:hypothetical protein
MSPAIGFPTFGSSPKKIGGRGSRVSRTTYSFCSFKKKAVLDTFGTWTHFERKVLK